MNATQNCEELTWSEWTYGYRCQHSKKINSINELFQIMTYMMELFDGLLKCSASTMPADVKTIACNGVLPQDEIVNIFERNLDNVLRLPLSIPNYQRIYCWEESNVKCLLDNVFGHISNTSETPYRLGTIILHAHGGKYDIIDGQQRLVTLALLLSEIGVNTSLLNEKFSSQRSINYVAYNKPSELTRTEREAVMPITV